MTKQGVFGSGSFGDAASLCLLGGPFGNGIFCVSFIGPSRRIRRE